MRTYNYKEKTTEYRLRELEHEWQTDFNYHVSPITGRLVLDSKIRVHSQWNGPDE